jgi:hypothetical protein
MQIVSGIAIGSESQVNNMNNFPHHFENNRLDPPLFFEVVTERRSIRINHLGHAAPKIVGGSKRLPLKRTLF